MRHALVFLATASLLSLTQACYVSSSSEEPLPSPTNDDKNQLPPPSSSSSSTTPAKPPTIVNPAQPSGGPATDADYQEVVYVFMRGHDASSWMCTGTLVAKDKVVTAAHCLDPIKFASYEVLAPKAAGAPRVSAKTPEMMSGLYDDVANPDIGFLTLSSPITLPAYAELTDVVARVEGGEKLTAAAVIREEQEAMSPLHVSDKMPLSSTVGFGYEHGFGTPMFSKGGDSGAGLFLVENGKTTHKLVGVARQPDPDRGIDHFTRISPQFKTWYTSKNPAGGVK